MDENSLNPYYIISFSAILRCSQMRKNQFQDSHRLCKGRFNRKFHEPFCSSIHEGGSIGMRTLPRRNFSRPMRRRATFFSRSAILSAEKVASEIGVGEREGWKSIERGKRERERRVEIVIHAPINGIRFVVETGWRVAATCSVMTRNASSSVFRKKKKKNAVGKLLSPFILFLSSVRYYYEVAKYTPNWKPIFRSEWISIQITIFIYPRMIVNTNEY